MKSSCTMADTARLLLTVRIWLVVNTHLWTLPLRPGRMVVFSTDAVWVLKVVDTGAANSGFRKRTLGRYQQDVPSACIQPRRDRNCRATASEPIWKLNGSTCGNWSGAVGLMPWRFDRVTKKWISRCQHTYRVLWLAQPAYYLLLGSGQWVI